MRLANHLPLNIIDIVTTQEKLPKSSIYLVITKLLSFPS